MIPPFSFNYFNDSVTVVLVNVVEVIVTVAVVEDVKLVVVTLVTVVVEDKLNVVLVVLELVCLMAMWGGPSQRHRGHHRVSWMWRFEILGWFENLACNDLRDRVPLCWRYRFEKSSVQCPTCYDCYMWAIWKHLRPISLGKLGVQSKKRTATRKSRCMFIQLLGIMYRQQKLSKSTSPCFRFQPFYLRVSLSLNPSLPKQNLIYTKYVNNIYVLYVHISCMYILLT